MADQTRDGTYHVVRVRDGVSFSAAARWERRARLRSPVRSQAIKAVAHKLARACYHMLREGTDFHVNRAFA